VYYIFTRKIWPLRPVRRIIHHIKLANLYFHPNLEVLVLLQYSFVTYVIGRSSLNCGSILIHHVDREAAIRSFMNNCLRVYIQLILIWRLNERNAVIEVPLSNRGLRGEHTLSYFMKKSGSPDCCRGHHSFHWIQSYSSHI
jgi:hypothetical protein